MRLLILCLLIYFGYRLFKTWVLPGGSPAISEEEGSLTAIDDVMVKDPFCETYFPQRQGIRGVINGETHYFCSTECRDKYFEAIQNSEQRLDDAG